MLLEYWVEHYHQVAHRYDCYWRAQPTHQKQAEVRSKMENAFRNVNTKKELRKVQSKYVRVRKRAKSLATVRKEAKINQERDSAVLEMMNVLAGASDIGAMGDAVDDCQEGSL